VEHSEIIARAIEGMAGAIRLRRIAAIGELAGLKSAWFSVRQPPPTEVDPTKLTAHNLRIVRTLLFGTGSFRQINSERQYVPLW
jgi:hypothetical protein